MKLRTLPLVTELEQQGFPVTTYEGMPTFTAVLPKNVILELSIREDVGNISLADIKESPELNSAVPNSLAPTVWARGFTGSGITIAILESGNVAQNNTYLHHAVATRAVGVSWHTTMVASVAASFHGTYRGIAYGATVLSAGEDGSSTDTITALVWAFDQGARIVNFSAGFEENNNINWTDRAFDYWARARFRFITKSAGNSITSASITSPGKAWNVLAVGAYDDNNNLDWLDD